jgi:CubicO group peptidase (beta-lactamase class C family)
MGRGARIEERAGRVRVGGAETHWPSSTPRDQGFDAATLEGAEALAGRHKAHSLLVIRNGRLVLERYWNGKSQADLQQTCSGTKSVFSLLVGRAIERGYLRDLEQPIRELVPEMPEAQTEITFRSVLAIRSGMENSIYDVDNHIARLLRLIVEAAS